MARALIFNLYCFFLLFFAFSSSPAVAGTASEKHVYSTWDVMELDACASAWLIKTFIDKEAVFKFFPKGEIIEEGTAFDTPDAELRRTAAASTFENILVKYKVKDPVLLQIGAIIHDVEINYWGQKQKENSLRLNEEITAIIKDCRSPQECLEKTFPVFEALYTKMSLFSSDKG